MIDATHFTETDLESAIAEKRGLERLRDDLYKCAACMVNRHVDCSGFTQDGELCKCECQGRA